MLPVWRALGAASPLPARCSGRLFALFQKSKPRKLATGCERQDSRSMRSSMKVRAASSSPGFGDSPAMFGVWRQDVQQHMARGSTSVILLPPGGSDLTRAGAQSLGMGGCGMGAALLSRAPAAPCCSAAADGGGAARQPCSSLGSPAAGQQPAQLQTARSGLLAAGPGLGMSSGPPARPACHSSPSCGDEQKVPILQVVLVVYRLSAEGGSRGGHRALGEGRTAGIAY